MTDIISIKEYHDANLRFEELAEQFRRETGFVAPSLARRAFVPPSAELAERQAAWDKWIAARAK